MHLYNFFLDPLFIGEKADRSTSFTGSSSCNINVAIASISNKVTQQQINQQSLYYNTHTRAFCKVNAKTKQQLY